MGCAVRRPCSRVALPLVTFSPRGPRLRGSRRRGGALGGSVGCVRRVLPKGVLGMPQCPPRRLPLPLAGAIIPLADVSVSKVPPSLACRFRDGVWCLQELASSVPTPGTGARGRRGTPCRPPRGSCHCSCPPRWSWACPPTARTPRSPPRCCGPPHPSCRRLRRATERPRRRQIARARPRGRSRPRTTYPRRRRMGQGRPKGRSRPRVMPARGQAARPPSPSPQTREAASPGARPRAASR